MFVEIFKNDVAEFRAQFTQLRQLKGQPDARRNKDADAKLSMDLKKKTLLPLFIQRIAKFTSVNCSRSRLRRHSDFIHAPW